MTHETRAFIKALSVELGTIIGAGVLGLPFVVAKVGFAVGMAYLVVMSVLITGLHLMVGEIVARTRAPLQMVGLARTYLGNTGRILMSLTQFLGSFGILLVYIIGAGIALQALLGGASEEWSIAFWAAGASALFFGLKLISRIDVGISIGIICIISAIAIASAPEVKAAHFFESDGVSIFLPYGVFLFALIGASGLPQVEEIVESRQTRFKHVILTVGVVVAALYALFISAVVGVTGGATTEVATVGLGRVVGHSMLVLGNLFAVLAVGGGFLNTSIATKRIMTRDFRMPHMLAWLIVSIVPFALFMLGARQFVATISIVGAVFGTINAVLYVLMYWRAHARGDIPARRFHLHHAALLSAAILIVFLIGALLTIFK